MLELVENNNAAQLKFHLENHFHCLTNQEWQDLCETAYMHDYVESAYVFAFTSLLTERIADIAGAQDSIEVVKQILSHDSVFLQKAFVGALECCGTNVIEYCVTQAKIKIDNRDPALRTQCLNALYNSPFDLEFDTLKSVVANGFYRINAEDVEQFVFKTKNFACLKFLICDLKWSHRKLPQLLKNYSTSEELTKLYVQC